MLRLAIPGLGTFGPVIESKEDAIDIAREVASTEGTRVEVISEIAIEEVVEPDGR